MIKKIYSSLFVLWAFIYTLISIKPALLFHVQQNPFFTNWGFFKDFAKYPGDLGVYISNIIMQLFHSNLLGSLVIIILAFSLSLTLHAILCKLKLINDLVFTIIPFSLALCLFHDYHFPLVILLQSVIIYLSIFLLLQLKKYTLILVLSLYILFYYIFGSGAAIIFATTYILITLIQSTSKPHLIKSLIILISAILLPIIAYLFIFNISFHHAFIQFIPEVPVTQRFNASKVMYAFLFLLPIILLFILLLSRVLKIDRFQNIIHKKLQITFHVIIICLMVGLVMSTSNKHERNIVEVDFYSNSGNFDKVIDIALADKTYDFSINLNYNRAIDYSGQFMQRFFEYPQLLGVTALSPDKLKTPIYTMQACDYYYDINYISKSQHMAYGMLTIEPYNVRALKRVVKTNLILGNYTAAQTFINILSLNPLSKEFVDQYSLYVQDSNYILNDPELSEKRRLQPTNFAIPANISDRIIDLIAHDSSNMQAYEHLQISFLLDHNLGAFIKHFEASVKFYNEVPEVYEQACLLYIYSTKTNPILFNRIGENSKNNFSYFIKTMTEDKNDLNAAQTKMLDLSNTYLYYTAFLSPRVTNLKINN